jgi:hypothetical protein
MFITEQKTVNFVYFVKLNISMAMKIQVMVFWVVALYIDAVGYQCFQCFRGPCCFHLQVMTPCNDEMGYQHFGGPCSLHLHVVIPYSDTVGYQCFGGSHCLHLQVDTM